MTLSPASHTILDSAEHDAAGITSAIDAFGSVLQAGFHSAPDPRNPFLGAAPSDPAEKARWTFYHQRWLPFVDNWKQLRSGLRELVSTIATDADATRLANALNGYRTGLAGLQKESVVLRSGSVAPTSRGVAAALPGAAVPHAAAPSVPSRAQFAKAPPADLWHEADARFWAQTGYKPGVKLDPKNPADAAMMPAYQSVYKTVLASWQRGELADPNAPGWTFKHPQVAASLAAASASSANTASALAAAQAATKAGDHATATQHLENANLEHATTVQQVSAAASVQPRSVSAAHVHQAVHQILHFHMNAAGVGELDPADAASAMQATSAPVLASANDTQQALTIPGQTMSPEVRGARSAWGALPGWAKFGFIIAGGGAAIYAAKSIRR